MFTPRIYLVRVWRQRQKSDGSAFRASVRAPTEETAKCFTRADALARFFEQQSEQSEFGPGATERDTPSERSPADGLNREPLLRNSACDGSPRRVRPSKG